MEEHTLARLGICPVINFPVYPVSASFITQRKREEIIALPCIQLFSYQERPPQTNLYDHSQHRT